MSGIVEYLLSRPDNPPIPLSRQVVIMINVEGTCYPVTRLGAYKATSAVSDYARLDVINFRRNWYEPAGVVVFQGERFARESDNDYTTCDLSISFYTLSGVRKLTSGSGTYAVTGEGSVKCITHPGVCCDSEVQLLAVSPCRELDHFVEKMFKRVERG